MTKLYRRGPGARVIDLVFRVMTRLGLGNGYRYLLTVRGRKSGRLLTTPVDVMEQAGSRWLVAAYGISAWVLNARVSGEVVLARSGRRETLRAVEVGPEESVPILRQYLVEVPVVRSHFDVTPGSSDQEFAAEAARHPVFRLAST